MTALLLLALLTGLSVAMFLAANSDVLTNGYYKNFRGSYYAADSGLTIVRQDMKDKIWANMVTADQDTPPLPEGVEATIVSQLKAAWADDSKFHSITDGSSVDGTVEAKFRIDPDSLTLEQLECHTDSPTKPNTCVGVTDASRWHYTYRYHMVSIGKAGPAHLNRVEEAGTLSVDVPTEFVMPRSFAGCGLCVENQEMCGSGLAGGTFYGPIYTAGCFTFNTQKVTFKDPVGCGGAKAGYQFGTNAASCQQKAGISATSGTKKIAPDFQGGLYFNVQKTALPEDSFSQKLAVVDAKGLVPEGYSDEQAKLWELQQWKDKASKLKDVNGTAFNPNSPAPGVYIPSENGKYSGGGFYVVGNASVTLSTVTTASTLSQVYTIINNGKTTKITVNQIPTNPKDWKMDNPYDPPYTVQGNLPGVGGNGEVIIESGGKKTTLSGIPVQVGEDGSVIDNGTMLYVEGSITSLSGQIQDDTALTITAAKDVTINGDVKYKTKPITTGENEKLNAYCCDGKPADTIAVGNDRGQALGIFTTGGNIYASLSKSGSMEIDASLATISKNGTGGFDIPESSAMINNLTIVGGRIHNTMYSTSKLGKRDVFFDRRFGSKLAPPFFPATKPEDKVPPEGKTTVHFQRQTWINQTSY